jgi:hypothetical protein
MTAAQPPGDDFSIPPVTAKTPPQNDADNSRWIIIGIVVFAVAFVSFFVIPTIVFSTAGNAEHDWVVAATVQQPDAGTIVLTYHGGPDAEKLVGMTVTVTDSSGQVQEKNLWSEPGTIPLPVGESVTFNGSFSGRDRVVARALFTDGKAQVVLDTGI